MSEVEASVEGMGAARSRAGGECLSAHAADADHGPDAEQGRHNRPLQTMLSARSKASIEYKHCNISAVLVELGVPPLAGYRPLFNYQRQLVPVVSEAIGRDARLDEAALRQVETPAEAPLLDSFERFVVVPPEGQKLSTLLRRTAGPKIANIRKARSRVSATVYTSPDTSRCAFSSTAVIASMSPVQRAALDRTQFNDFRCCSLAA
jgi:hypothetical protein